MTPYGPVAGTGRTGLMGFVDRNPELVGGMAKGALQAAAAGDGGTGRDYTAAMEARIAADEALQSRIEQSHNVSGGLLKPTGEQTTGGLLPKNRWNTSETAYSNGRWVYDEIKGRVVFVPNAPQQAA